MRRATHAGAPSSVFARVKQDDGIALVLTLIVMGVLTIGTIAVVTAMNSNEQAFGRDRQTNRALNVAEAGLNAGVAAVQALPATATSLSPASGTVDQGAWSYTTSRSQDATNPDLYYWTITSTGVSPDGKVTRIVSTKVSETVTHHSQSQTVTTPASAAYGYGLYLGNANQTCDAASSGPNVFGASFQLTSDAYVKGDFCVSAGVRRSSPSRPRTSISAATSRRRATARRSAPSPRSSVPSPSSRAATPAGRDTPFRCRAARRLPDRRR